jgi:pyruvate ferredoxin oxidoreductase gamma subunit
VIVQDSTLIDVVNVIGGLKDTGALIINTKESSESFKKLNTKAKIMTVDATKIAMDIMGVPIVNTVLLGAFAAATGEVAVASIQEAVKERFSGKVGENNAQAIQIAYDFVKKEMKT